jgi:CheY-like chemotaxis protein
MSARPKVLVIDDEILVAATLRDILEALGTEVVGTAHGFDEALVLIEAQPDCAFAFIDLKLGAALSGVQLAQRAVELGIQVIAVTGSPRLPDGLQGAALLTKPFSVEAVRRVLDMLRPRGG